MYVVLARASSLTSQLFTSASKLESYVLARNFEEDSWQELGFSQRTPPVSLLLRMAYLVADKVTSSTSESVLVVESGKAPLCLLAS